MRALSEFRSLVKLAVPLIAAQLAQIGIEVVDTLAMGRLGEQALAAGALALPSILFVMIICIGIMAGQGILVARAFGADDDDDIREKLAAGLQLALLLSIPSIILLLAMPRLMILIGLDPLSVDYVSQYIRLFVFAYPCILVFISLRELLNALNHPTVVTLTSTIAIPLNIFGNWVFGFGKLGVTAMGISGIALATVFTNILMITLLFGYIASHSQLQHFLPGRKILLPRWAALKEIFALGLPIGLQGFSEVSLFSVTAILMGYFGEAALAAHQISMQCITITFMFFLGISQATSIRLNQCLGAKDYSAARHNIVLGLLLSLLISLVTAGLYWGYPKDVADLYVNTTLRNHTEIIEYSIQFLAIAGVFQMLDALQVTATGVLRGFKDTKVPALLGVSSFWMFGLGSGAYLAFAQSQGSTGLWWGIAIGVGASATLLLIRVWMMMKRMLL